jgi:PKD repeat protein
VLFDATPTIGTIPLQVEFDANATYDPDTQPISFLWDFGDGESSTDRNPIHVYSEPGVYDAELTVTEQTAPFASASDTVRITVGNSPPLATIHSPTDQSSYRVGDVIHFSGTATSGPNPVSADDLDWELRTLHNQHSHFDDLPSAPDPVDPFRSVGDFSVSDHGDSVSLQLCVTATIEPEGFTDTQCVDLLPEKTQVTLATEPVGLAISYEDEGIEVFGPALIHPVVGSEQTISVLPIQQHRSFAGWDDGEPQRSRSFTVGTTPLTFTAVYENRAPSAVASPSAAGGPAPFTVAFDAALSSDPEDDALEYAWDAGAVGTSGEQAPSFTFLFPGTYAVTLTVMDQLGANDTDVVAVEVTDYGAQTRPQRRCVQIVNRGIARIARAHAAAARRCLADAAAGRVERLGPGGTFDACLDADVDSRVARATQRIGAREPRACSAEPPELALGADRLSGVGPASVEGSALVRDLLGEPATPVPETDRAAARCQAAAVAGATDHLRLVLAETRRAVDGSLAGRLGDPAATDVELTLAVDASLASSDALPRGAQRLARELERRCDGVADLAALVPGCGAADSVALASCIATRSRCRACRVSVAADPGLALDCDAFDDAVANASCPGD